MKTRKHPRNLNRYTTLPILLDMLMRKKIVLLDPSTWEDKNDSQIILEYKVRKRIPKLFAVCFSIGDETIHHWKTYADGIAGCCIEFNEDKLLKSFQGINGIRWGDVTYKKIKEVKENTIELEQIPFVKRHPYRVEREFRVIWEGRTDRDNIEMNIDLNSINRITISQNMPRDVCDTIVELLREHIKDPEKKIIRSTIFENRRWIRAFKNN